MDYYRPSKEEIEKYGLVFTPNKIINQMLDQLPKEVWSNPNLKWLDPCAGIGNFAFHIGNRLFDGLRHKFDSNEQTYIHIWTKMIYMCELYDKNANLIIQNFGKDVNLFIGDFLIANLKKEFSVDKFDIIVGNPPYTVGVLDKKIHTKYYKLSGTGTKKSPHLYFTKCAMDVLKDDGYLLFINPYNYFSNPSSQDYRNVLNEYNYHITLFGDDVFQDVKVTSAIHLITKNPIGKYLIKGNQKVEPLIIDGKIMKVTDLLIQSILIKMTENSFSHLFDTKLDFQFGEFRPDKAIENGQYHIIHGAKTFQCDKEPRDRFSVRLYINEIRNINSYPPISDVWITTDPNVGFSINNLYYVCVNEEYAEYVKRYIKSELFQYIFSCIKDNNHNSKHLLNMFIIPLNLKKDFSSDDLYKYFELTEEEIKIIRKQ